MSHCPSPQQQLGAYLRGELVGSGNLKTEKQLSATIPHELYILERRHMVSQICHRVNKQDTLKIVSPW
jgi:hypothetical protein